MKGLSIGLALLVAVTFVLSLLAGRVWLPPQEILNTHNELARLIVSDLRLPRTVLALLVGASLGLSGAVLQGLTRNPLAEPGLLGVSTGAALGAVLDQAGGRNIAVHDSYYDVESLIAAKPDILAFADDYIDTPSLRRDQDDHPLLMRLFANRRIVYPAAYFGCGTPESAGAALKLRGQLLQAMTKPGGVP